MEGVRLILGEAIIVDLDGTLCDSTHRKHFVENVDHPKDFDSFYRAAKLDKPNRFALEIVQRFERDFVIFFVTGRPEQYRELTLTWFDQFEITPHPLLMRRNGDYQPDWKLKRQLYRDHIKPLYTVLFCLDDRRQVVQMWRTEGLTVLQCAEGDF